MAVKRLHLLHIAFEDLLQNLGLRKDFLVFPDGLMAGDITRIVDAQPVLQHDVLEHLLHKVLVGFAKETLCEDALEHEHRIHWPAPRPAELTARFSAMSEAVRLNSLCDRLAVRFKIKELVQGQKHAGSLFGTLQKCAVGRKKIALSCRLTIYSVHNGFLGVGF